MRVSEPITLRRDCEAIEIPSGTQRTLASGTVVRIMQKLGGSYTVTAASTGQMLRISDQDADALGLAPAAPQSPTASSEFSEQMVWDQLKTVYDPEIPVNLVDLGLIYSCEITPLSSGEHKIDVKMTMTAPGCGMGNVLKADVERKLARLPGVKEVHVEIVFDPPWNQSRMSEAARLQLGLDLDDSSAHSALPIYPDRRK
jgi:probable FeS assembly SUF system protein SufT